MLLPQHHVKLGTLPLVKFAETTVAVAFRVRLPVFLPQQLQREVPVLAQLFMNRSEVLSGSAAGLSFAGAAARGNSAASSRASSQPSGGGQPMPAASALQGLADRAHPDGAASADLLATQM
jgi:hypothetical protein